MEKGKEYLAKIIDRESEFLISEKYVIIGRSNLIKFSDEVQGKIIFFKYYFYITTFFSIQKI